jgi:hypothetical protein
MLLEASARKSYHLNNSYALSGKFGYNRAFAKALHPSPRAGGDVVVVF